MADDKEIGFKTGAGAATGVGGLLSLGCQFLPPDYVKPALTAVPFFSPFISLLLILAHNKFIEDPGIVAMRAKLKRDLKRLKKLQKDKYADDETRAQAKKDYSATMLHIANLGKKSLAVAAAPKNSESSTP